ncbi:MAG: MBL fold metallo-hydrolase, partial [Candidatus Babeliales bacterium]
MKLTFLGAVEEVTGSKYLVEHEGRKILVDCGLFQEDEELNRRNVESFPVEPDSIDAVVLTHAHIDHTGYIPALVKNGFKGKIYCSKATYALCRILLLDSGHIQEESAKRDESIAYPLYTQDEAESSLRLFHVVDYNTAFDIGNSLQGILIYAGHIPGASSVILTDGKKKITFSGDVGRPNQRIMKAPTPLKQTDYLVLESTYGDRLHPDQDVVKVLGKIIDETIAKKGMLIIPCFAVGRTQVILYCLYQLKQKKLIPDIPIFLDSPMAIAVNDMFCAFHDEYRISEALCRDLFTIATYTPTVDDSKRIGHVQPPAIIIAGSGMATGGRVLHHFKHFISDEKNTILFVGFQAEGTLGHALVEGIKEFEIHDVSFTVNAQIKQIE